MCMDVKIKRENRIRGVREERRGEGRMEGGIVIDDPNLTKPVQ